MGRFDPALGQPDGGDFANVAEQSGIVAGAGGYHVAVGGGVDLKAGVIASSAEKDNNALSADHLTYSNLDNVSKASSSGFGLSVGIGADGKPSIPTPSVSQPANEDQSGRALATLTPGTLNLDNQTQDLSGLNTDLGKANTTVSPYDIDRLKAKQESAAALSELLNGLTGDISNQLGFKEGSPEKIALHTAVGAIVAKLAGGDIAAGAAAGAASEIANGVLQEVLKANPNLSDADSKAITQWVAVVVGAAAGGETGAATGLDNVNHNFLTHQQADELAQKLEKCQSDGDPTACKARVSQEYVDLDFEQEHKLDACRTTKCVTDLLGDLNGDPEFAYTKVLKLQELGVSEELAQRLLAYQVRERWLTGDASVFEQRIMDVVAGASYCEANGGSDGCFLKGQALKYSSDAVMAAAYAILGLPTSVPGKGGKTGQGSQGEAANGGDLPSGYRELRSSAGAAANTTGGLPSGYRRVVAPNGDIEVLGPNGRIYASADDLPVPSGKGGTTAGQGEASNATNTELPKVPGRVQSRVNLATGDKSSGWTHVIDRHFNQDKNASQFTISKDDLRTTLQSSEVVTVPVTRSLESADHGTLYVREVDLGRPIGTDKFNNFQTTSKMTVMTDRFGNLVTATPGFVR